MSLYLHCSQRQFSRVFRVFAVGHVATNFTNVAPTGSPNCVSRSGWQKSSRKRKFIHLQTSIFNVFSFFFSFSFMCFVWFYLGCVLQICDSWKTTQKGLSSVLKQREFYDPRFITWIESRFDTYVQSFILFFVTVSLVSAIMLCVKLKALVSVIFFSIVCTLENSLNPRLKALISQLQLK